MKNILRFAAIAVAIALAGCAHDIPTKSHMGYVWNEAISACRGLPHPTNECVTRDLARAMAQVDYANPGRDEATYMGIINSASTVAGAALGYTAADIQGRAFANSMTIVTGEVGGSGLGTALTYNKVLYRAAVEAIMYSYGRDPQLDEQYFGLVAYTGQVEHFDELLTTRKEVADDLRNILARLKDKTSH